MGGGGVETGGREEEGEDAREVGVLGAGEAE